MYKCLDCKNTFEQLKVEKDDLTPGGSFEGGSFIQINFMCPHCDSSNFEEATYCNECERTFGPSELNRGLCDECYEELEK